MTAIAVLRELRQQGAGQGAVLAAYARSQQGAWHAGQDPNALAQHVGIALAGLLRVTHTDHIAVFDSAFDERLRMRDSLAGIAVQHVLAGFALQYQSQFPGQVHRIARTGAQPLAQKGRRQVRSVTGDEDAPFAPLVAPAGAEGVDGLANNVQSGVRQAGFSQHLVERFG